MCVFASRYAGLIASGLSLAGIFSVIAAGLHLLRMVNSVHTSHQLRTSQRGGGFSFAGKWSSAHPSGRYGILMRSCILTRSSPSLAVLAGILLVCARGVCVRCAVIESSTLHSTLLLLYSLLCFYFTLYFTLYFASTLLSTLLPTFLNLIPNLIFLRAPSSGLRGTYKQIVCVPSLAVI